MSNKFYKIVFVIGLLMMSTSVYGQQDIEAVLRRKIEEAMEKYRREHEGEIENETKKVSETRTEKRSKREEREDNERSRAAAEEMRARKEAEKREQRRQEEKRAEEERRRTEKAFKEDKEELSKSLRGMNESGKSSGYSTGLRGMSDDASSKRKNSFSTGLRGLSDEGTSTGSALKGTYEAYFGEEEKTYEHNYYDSRSSIGKEAVTSFSPAKPAVPRPQKSDDLIPAVVEAEPRPVYYQGPAFYGLGAEDESKESIIDKVENQIDVWREAGEHKVLTYVGEKITGFARKTVSTKSAMGAQVMKVYDFLNDAADVFNLEKNVATRSLDAIKKSAITEDSRYVDEVNLQNKADIDNAYNRYMVDHGLLPSDAKAAEKLMKKEIKKEAKKTGEIWLGRIIK